ncbi:MAG TPA: ATPase, T2SS/T4P/T4SS family [Candidatus Cybelea sp.]|jgi:pilus assembly protein CpaF|nr:ATPase, T2SS/T4P/T4SS family [Candidatus Cybelea sp.]
MSDSPIALFVGSKGGVGATTLCCELARTMGQRGNVALVDADLTGRRGVAVLFEAIRTLDAARVGSPISRVRAGGISLIELADRYDAAFMLDPETVEAAAAEMTGFSVVVVDAPQPFAAAARPFLARASRIFLVLEPTLLGVAGAQAMYADLIRFGIPANRIAVVTNARSDDAVTRSQVERTLGAKVLAEVPPLTNRGYAKSVAGIAQYFQSLPPEDQLSGLQPSAASPPGDAHVPLRRTTATRTNGHRAPATSIDPKRDAFKQLVHQALLRQIDLVSASVAQTDADKLAELRSKIESITSSLLASTNFEGSAEDLAALRQEILDEALGLGPLEDLMKDPDVSEIMVNRADTIYVERHGIIEKTTKRFADDRQLRLVIERIITPLGRRIDESSPMVDARLSDGSRVNAIIEPVAIDGTSLTIRRFGQRRLTADDLVKIGAAPQVVMNFLSAAVKSRLNCIVSGGTGSGKTTFLNVMSSFLPERERIVTIEDAAELLLNQPHIVRLESRPPNVEGTGEIRIRDLFRNALRMRPDRIIIGECRGSEALDMLQAMNTGHDGSLTTIHANSQRDAISRVETMVLMAGFDLPVRAIREQIASALDLVVHTSRLRDGSRKVIGVSEVVGMEGDIVTMQEIMRFAQRGVDKEDKVVGEFCSSGVQPVCLKRFAEYGVPYDARELSELAPLPSLW